VGYILVESGYGSKEPLIRTQLEPKIQGVVIVCEGADNIRVEQSLINVATTTLGISSARVCVEKIAVAE
jgi:stage III sporulation protein AG